jgi:hypothetical protein
MNSVPPAPLPPPVSGFTTVWGVTINPSLIVLSVAILGLIWLVYLAQKSSKPFDVRDLIMEDGKLSPTKSAFMAAFLMTSWVIVDLEIKARLTDTLFGGYLLAWVGPLTAKVIFNKSDVSIPAKKEGA